MRMRRRTTATLIAALGAGTLALPCMASAATIANGGFESGDFTGWVKAESGSGAWSVYTGTAAQGGLAVGSPPEGTHGAATSQTSPGSHVLYQDVALEAGSTHTLTLWIYWRNNAAFVTPSPETLSQSGSPNQQYRVDVMRPSAAVSSVDPADTLASIYQSRAGDPLTQTPKQITADLSALAGQTVRIRIAETDNQNYFSAAADDVRIDSAPIAAPEPVPTPDETTPDATTPDATTPDATTPDATTPDATTPATCRSQRRFTIHLRPALAALTTAVVKVNGKTVTVRKGKRLTAVVDLRGLHKGTYHVTINARDAAGRHHREIRSYETC
jgi:hypothetical protein